MFFAFENQKQSDSLIVETCEHRAAAAAILER